MALSGTVDVPPAALRPAGRRLAVPRSAVPLLVGGAAAVVAVTAIAGTWERAPYPPVIWLLTQAAGLSFIVSGTVLWRGRPGNATGPLMTATGLAAYLGNLQLLADPVAFAIGFCFYHLGYALLGHLVLALPDGRLAGGAERRLVALLYVAATGTQIVRFAAEYPPQPQGWGDPAAAYSVWATVGSVTVLALTLVIVVLVVRRWSAFGRPVRRLYAPVWLALLAMGAAAAVHAVGALADTPLGDRQWASVAYASGFVLTPVALAAGLLRVRWDRLRVAGLVVRLRETVEPEDVRAALAEVLDDPTAELWFPRPDGAGHTDPHGRTVRSVPTGGRTATSVVRRGEVLAVLVHDPLVPEHQPMVDAVLAAAGLALDNARLLAAQRAQTAELRASRSRIVVAADTERRRIQRDLHDGVQHRLLAVSMLIGRAQEPGTRPGSDLPAAAAQLREAVRDLRLLTEGVHPPALAEQGLAAAVESLAERATLPVRVAVPARRWPDHLERAVYFVVAEALANVGKHAAADRAEVVVEEHRGRLRVRIGDDGLGGADPGRGTGLRGLADRVSALDGTLRVDSPPGDGTRLVVELPCE